MNDPSFRFSKRSRLATQTDFSNVFSRSTKIHFSEFSLHAKPNLRGFSRLGLAVSRKVSLKATIRNRIKRIVRESFRLNQTRIGSLDVIFVAKPHAVNVNNAVLTNRLNGAWQLLVKKCEN